MGLQSRFLVARAAQAAVVVGLVVSLAFALVHAAPGDPFGASFDDPSMTAEQRVRLRAEFGYDQPLTTQYVRWVVNVARGELGWSHTMGRPVAAVLRDAIPNTLLLMSVALILGFAAGIALGAWQGARRGTLGERATSVLALMVVSVPEFLLALAALTLLAARWRLFPITGMVDAALHDAMSAGGRARDVLAHLALPAATLALAVAGLVSRYQRAAMLTVLPDDFVRTARAKGVSERGVLFRHALRNALGPVISVGGLLLPALAGGAVFVEKIFSWPGMGLTMVNAVTGRDYPLVLSGVLVGSVLVAVGGVAADVTAAAIDPRAGASS